MPTPTTSKFPKPKSWDEFEDIVTDIMKNLWQDPYIKRNGRQGQKQNGVDIYGSSKIGARGYHGAQCKNTDSLKFEEIEREVLEAEHFTPPLISYLIATTASRDTKLEERVRVLSLQRINNGKFEVNLFFWEDLCLELSGNRSLLEKYFPGWVDSSTSEDSIMQIIEESSPSDWIYIDQARSYTYKKDVQINIKLTWDNNPNQFGESWARRFPDPSAYAVKFTIYHGTSPIKEIYTGSIDGSRCYIPYPKSMDFLTITPWNYNFGKIVNIANGEFQKEYDSYVRRAGITVEE